MALHYFCRYCGTKIGQLENISYHSNELGFDKLTDEERREMINYDASGNITINSICEDCHESFEKNPNNYENDFIIH
ncbi:anti-sigma-F factor Fin family protein [Bacillus kwashiorkori]|uniref:anti-sigma-F factor Fin family protein n=1 Tax=Bacillus kwashiorkori TaxID=1522318 RepID=UPI0007810515|nr:anti-sigma-F factor Fin family protein [Bacillus kwashiorkori]